MQEEKWERQRDNEIEKAISGKNRDKGGQRKKKDCLTESLRKRKRLEWATDREKKE